MRQIITLLAVLLFAGCSSGPTPMIPPLPPAEKAQASSTEDTEEDGEMDDSGFGDDPLAGADMLDDVEPIEETPEKPEEDAKTPAEGEAKPNADGDAKDAPTSETTPESKPE